VENNKIALTFDDGPSQGVTQSVMSSLAAANVKATFFVVGSMVDQTPSLLAAEVAAGHSTVSHSYSHPSLTSLSQAEVYQEMFKTETAFGNAGVCRRPTLMRPPYGDINSNLDKFLRRMGYRAMIWNLDTMDWQDAQSNPNLVVSNFKTNFNNLMPSGILSLQHDLFQYTADIVPSILSFIQTKSYEFVSVERCVWGPNYQRHPSWVHMHRMCDQAVANWPAVTPSESCPVSEWSDWSDCDVSCGPGTQTRVRLTMPPSLAQTSAACGSVPLIESRACSGQAACSSSCTYNAWTNWGACSKSCGGGTQIQTRTVKSGGSGCGAVLQTQVCNTQACVSSPARRALRGE
jgi:peptidoglycan/xylan/chitin deacetylase (PgdA/CDA1 family)